MVSDKDVSRRSFGRQVVSTSAFAWLAVAAPSHGLSTQQETDKQKILRGYKRLSSLLDNWEEETTVCGVSDNPYVGTKAFGKSGCERTPMKVMEYMGYRSTDDPLFKAEKTLRRLEALVPPERESDFIEAVEIWSEKADEASGMAYVSSWGEANPGGGKDRVEYFIERSRNDVVAARDALGKVIAILDIK